MDKIGNAEKTSMKMCWLGVLRNISKRASWLFLITLQKFALKCSSDLKIKRIKYSCQKHLIRIFISSILCSQNTSKPITNRCICMSTHMTLPIKHTTHTHTHTLSWHLHIHTHIHTYQFQQRHRGVWSEMLSKAFLTNWQSLTNCMFMIH